MKRIVLFLIIISLSFAACTDFNACGTSFSANTCYRLTASITGAAATDCLTISATNVSINLNGYTVSGGASSSSSAGGDGIEVASGGTYATIANGTVNGGANTKASGSPSAGHGIYLTVGGSAYSVIKNIISTGGTVASSGTAGSGIYTTTANPINITNITAIGGSGQTKGVGGYGIRVYLSAIIINTTAIGGASGAGTVTNTGNGLYVSYPHIITNSIFIGGNNSSSSGFGGNGIYIIWPFGGTLTNITAKGGNGGTSTNSAGNGILVMSTTSDYDMSVTLFNITGGSGDKTDGWGAGICYGGGTIATVYSNITLLGTPNTRLRINVTTGNAVTKSFSFTPIIQNSYPTNPGDATNVSAYLNFTSYKIGTGATLNHFYLYYTSLGGSYNENNINLWNYSGGAWNKLSPQATYGTLDTTNDLFDLTGLSNLPTSITIGLFNDNPPVAMSPCSTSSNGYSWTWCVIDGTKYTPTSSASNGLSWTWAIYSASSGNYIRSGSPYSWSWVAE